MQGEIVAVWADTWQEIWALLEKHPDYGEDLFKDLFREIIPYPSTRKPLADLTEDELEALHRQENRYEEIASDTRLAKAFFIEELPTDIKSENKAINILKKAFNVISDYGDEEYTNSYFLCVDKFLKKYSLRYDLRRPFLLFPTLPGFFTGLINELKEITQRDEHLNQLMIEFEDSIRDLNDGQSSGKIKTCIQKQVNLLEAIGQLCPGARSNTLGRICDEVKTWPHDKVKEAMKNLYGFASDYPGIRHGGTPRHRSREIEIRDLIAISILLAGFSPYLTDLIDSHVIYNGR